MNNIYGIFVDDIEDFVAYAATASLGVMAFGARLRRPRRTDVGACEALIAHACHGDTGVVADICASMSRLGEQSMKDAAAIFDSDPAASCIEEIICCYPGFFAVFCYRLARLVYPTSARCLARMITEYAASLTGVDIHPGAEIGESLAIDHGSGIVVGETAYIGNNVRMYHGVTLGALKPGNKKELRGVKRHPSIMDNCILCAGATVLGGDTVVGSDSVIGAGTVLTHSLPCGSVYVSRPSCRRRDISPYS